LCPRSRLTSIRAHAGAYIEWPTSNNTSVDERAKR
jgi:hypothetical protein